jgi:hypothetical protein
MLVLRASSISLFSNGFSGSILVYTSGTALLYICIIRDDQPHPASPHRTDPEPSNPAYPKHAFSSITACDSAAPAYQRYIPSQRDPVLVYESDTN